MKSDTVLIKDSSTAVAQDNIILARTGKTVTFDELMKDLNSSQIVFIGEKHTNPSHHIIQLKIIQTVFKNHHS
ncbi:MAG: ChaN family lipoprotein, partial [Desulfobacterales bacterium]|nr:ChaN family lipoprotein [Desulfobacterales bacterium]